MRGEFQLPSGWYLLNCPGIAQSLGIRASRRREVAKEYDIVGLGREFAQNLREDPDDIRELIFGFIAAATLGLYLAWTICRSRPD
jgi:hypothetical protein